MLEKTIAILGRTCTVAGDEGYLGNMGDRFEPDTCALLAALCDETTTAIDIGANLGLTALALSQLTPQGRVIAFEPVPTTHALLEANLLRNDAGNVRCVRCALGASDGFAKMWVDERNLATSFIANTAPREEPGDVPVRRLDDCIASLGVERVDLIKIDVEGFELDVLAGASQVLSRSNPMVLLEMNHWCLGVFRRITIPEFHERLLQIFPALYAVDVAEVVDFRHADQIGRVFHDHIIGQRFMHVVGGFDRGTLERRLAQLMPAEAASAAQERPAEPASAAQERAPVPLRQRLRRSIRILTGREV